MCFDPDRDRFVSDADPLEGPRRVSYHTSGRVNYGSVVTSSPKFFEPLFDITQRNHFLLISIPCVERLELGSGSSSSVDGEDETGFWDIPSSVSGRITFGLVIAPLDDDGGDMSPHVRLGYDTFAVFITLASLPVPVTEELKQHFIYGAPDGLRSNQFCGRFEAELAYHQARTGQTEVIIYGPDDRGVYTLYPSRVMRVQPDITVEFAEPGLLTEVIEGSRANRVRFRIRGPGGYITNRDLRPLIRSIILNAEI